MLPIHIQGGRALNSETNEIINVPPMKLKLEHSLISISKWESKWKKPFLDDTPKTRAELEDYILCMSLSDNIDPNIVKFISKEDMTKIDQYIGDSKTATWFREKEQESGSSKKITSELIYYWMIAYNIPFKCEQWHLSRLLTLVRVCEAESKGPRKMSMEETIARNKALNTKRRAEMKSKG